MPTLSLSNEDDRELFQSIFNKVWKGLESQNWQRSLSSDGTQCCYRGENGTKCAIGHLFADSQYLPEMDRYAVPWKAEEVAKYIGLPTHFTAVNFYRDLQRVHDSFRAHRPLKDRYKDMAREWGLDVPND